MIVYRLTRSRFKNDLSGKGAEMAGGRWNSIGIPVLYTAESRALCALEIAVHTPLNVVPEDYRMITIEIHLHTKNKEIFPEDLPSNWRSFPEVKYTQMLGDRFFLEGKYLALRVPSAIVPGDYNILVNPLHKDFHSVKVIAVDAFEFDQRLFVKEIPAMKKLL
jgi:RES domain-containing protein